jgi:hypothetical protein
MVDQCIYVKHIPNLPPLVLCLYVDDTIIASHEDAIPVWNRDKALISQCYKIKDIGVCRWVLGMSVEQSDDRSVITLSQHTYIHELLKQFMSVDCKPASTPHLADHLFDPTKQDGYSPLLLTADQHMRYRSIVGALLYAANTTRADIALVVNQLARYVDKPCAHHMVAAKHVLRYLKGTEHFKMRFIQQQSEPHAAQQHTDDTYTPQEIVIYTDASWGELSIDGRRSMTGVLVQLYGNCTHWTSKVQTCTALSSCESEYIAIAAGVQEAIWCRNWIAQLLNKHTVVTLYVDNQSAICTALNDHSHERTKHIDIRLHFIRDIVRMGLIQIRYVPTDYQLADCLTKPLERIKLNHFRQLIYCE